MLAYAKVCIYERYKLSLTCLRTYACMHLCMHVYVANMRVCMYSALGAWLVGVVFCAFGAEDRWFDSTSSSHVGN